MYVDIQNKNYGYSVATYGDYVAVSNPNLIRWSITTSSVFHTGSLDYFRYNKNTDQHDYIGTIFKNFADIDVFLLAESGDTLATDTAALDILIDKDRYTASLEDLFGISVDMYKKLLVVSSPYYTQAVITSASFYSVTASAVEVHDLSKTEFIPLSQSTYVLSLYNPDEVVSESFGRAVSINSSWIAVGSPYVSSSKGMVYIYQNTSTGSNYNWSLYQKITGSNDGDLFGWDLKLNKQSGSYSQSLVVGCGNITSSTAYYFEFISGSWLMTYNFLPTTDIYPLTFGNYTPYQPTMSIVSGYGYAVSTYGTTVIIGAPKDRIVFEYSGSSVYNQGSVYVYEKCLNSSQSKFDLVLKTYGTSSILKNNLLGYSVDVFENYATAGIPKIEYLNNLTGKSICIIEGTIEQSGNCTSSLDEALLGQMMLLNKNTSSGDWGIKNIYQKKKKYLSPYRGYGYDVSIADRSLVVGAPLLMSGSEYQVNITYTSNSGVILDDIMGKAYIYNLANCKETFHVGNVFYRNGRIVVMTSGSTFDGLFYDPLDIDVYKYYLQFQGQHTIFEKQIVCTVDPGEFNVSTNPSAIVKNTGFLDINGNGHFDFQDVDIILRYMQYKNTSILGVPVTTEWSSSIVKTDDERSLYNFYISQSFYNHNQTIQFASESIVKWELVDTTMQNILDLNQDNKIDIRDMNILWKYFSNRLTQENYSTYITPSCERKNFSDIIDYIDFISQKNGIPYIKSEFLDYERLTTTDKTGSFLAPLATTIGLYNGLDLIAVAKLGTPIKITPEFPINFVIKMDW
jgi:hypothetical protein